jgi:hypothetical protein
MNKIIFCLLFGIFGKIIKENDQSFDFLDDLSKKKEVQN